MTILPKLEPIMALFLDFDGTLAELAPRPEDVRVSPEMISALGRVQSQLSGAVAVVSGRPIEQIDRFLSPLHLPAAGLHGLEHRLVPNAGIERDQPSPDIAALKNLLNTSDLVKRGAFIEDKGPAVAVHYRSVPELEADVLATMSEAVKALPALHLVHGKMVVEAKPFTSDKGFAVRTFMKNGTFAGRLPVFVGDDVTDEDGIAAAQELGGIGIKVGEGDTCARHRLENVAAVNEWLAAFELVSES
ncbi:trehalose-phosphatase [Roseibium sp.]|uniref:trehalose-phosphatase n=1 Tax=Roseibium sp. TaxID=1936156 RepID=UPI003A975C9B